MREEADAVVRTESPAILSPTALTNGIRRDNKSPGRQRAAPPQMTFLAAEHFQGIGAPPAFGGSRGPMQTTIPFVETVGNLTEGDNSIIDLVVDEDTEASKGSFEGCKSPLMRRPKNCREVRDVAFEVKEVAMSEPVQTAVKEQYLKPAQAKTKQMMESVQTTAKQARDKAVEMQPDEEQVRGCIRESRATGDKVARFANLVYDMFAQECHADAERGDERGDDSMFFRYGSHSTRTSPDVDSRNRAFSPMSSNPSDPDDDAFRSPKKSMRYPQAAKIENPVERSERKKKGSRSPSESREDTTDSSDESIDLGSILNRGDDQASLREVRLQMYKGDDGQESIPRARLTRALGELSYQDTTIETLQAKLDDTKQMLQEKEERLVEAERLCRKHERKIQELMAKAAEERRSLETRIAREAQAKGKLQSKIDVLQKEIFRLRAALGESATDTQTLTSVARSVASKNVIARADSGESGTDNEEVWEGIISEDEENTAVEVSLRAEIVSLKSQLADTQAEASQASQSSRNNESKSASSSRSANTHGGMYMSPDSVEEEVSALRKKLEAAETELEALREAKRQDRNAEGKVASLEKQLSNVEAEFNESLRLLEEAKATEESLLKKLEVAREKITKLENERSSKQMESFEEAEDLKLLYANDSKESEEAKEHALLELKKSRVEVDELKAEVKRLTETIQEMSQNSVVLTEERLKERDRLEEALHRCKNTEHQLRDRILELEEKLEKAQTSSLQLVASSSSGTDEGRSVKRKLDDSFDSDTGQLVTRESFQFDERVALKEELRRSRAAEEKLRSEMAITRQLLHCAEKVVAEMEDEMKEDVRQRNDNEARIMKELDELREKLKASEEKNSELIAARAKEAEARNINDNALLQSEAKQQSLLKQVHVLKLALESVEKERREEKMEMAEERRIHDDLESKRIKEIDSLRVDLANERAKAAKSNDLQIEVDKLRARLSAMQTQSVEMRQRATLESRKKDEMSDKLRDEMSAVKQRLAAIRRRNATRRQKEERKRMRRRPQKPQKQDPACPTTDDMSSSSSGDESGHSFSFSTPAFGSPDRRSTATSTTGSPSSVSRSSALRSSPSWSSPERPLGSFPSPPRQRVDVSSLRQRLEESNQRLQDATTRLSGLEESTDNMAQEEQAKSDYLSDEVSTLVAEHSDFSDASRSPKVAFHKMVEGRMATETKTVRWPGTEAHEEASI